MTRRVVLVHGLLMFGGAMQWFAMRLREAGFQAETFGYHSIIGGPDAAQSALARRLGGGDPAHVVAHSLGGLLALETLSAHPQIATGRVVCLGAPLCGSGAAESLAGRPMLRWWLGRSAALLRQGCVRWPEDIEVGMVAGDTPHGLGALFARFDGAHDGTVEVPETRHERLTDHITIASSHSGLIFSRHAARQAVSFLDHGHFDHAAGR